MNRILVDTCVWIEFFRHGEGAVYDFLDDAIESGKVVTCGVVLSEILRGARGKKPYKLISDIFQALPYLDIDRRDWEEAARLLAEAQHKGFTIPLTDGLIAQICIRHGLQILTFDKHFNKFSNLKMLDPKK